MKKKYVLKQWVKDLMLGVIIGLMIVITAMIICVGYNKAVDNCINGGNTKEFCKKELAI